MERIWQVTRQGIYAFGGASCRRARARTYAGVLCGAVLLLAGCGGGTEAADPGIAAVAEPANPSAAMDARRQLALRVTVQTATPPTVSTTQAFAWAEWALPALFPAVGTEATMVYEGTTYTVRTYANGNSLGFTPEGGVWGLGPYTGWKLASFGMLRDYAAQIVADACRVQGVDCTLPIVTSQPLNYHGGTSGGVYFELAYQSPGPATIQWQYSRDGGRRFQDIADAKGTRLVPRITFQGHYRARITNVGGSVLTRPVVWDVRDVNSAADLFPVAPGSQWTYTNSRSSTPTVMRVVGTHLIDGKVTTAIETRDGLDGTVTTEYFSVDADGVRDYVDPADQTTPELRLLSGQRILPYPLTSLTQVDAIIPAGEDVDGDGIEDSIRVVARVSPWLPELVKTEAGIFASAINVQQALHETLVLTGSGQADSPFLTLWSTTWWVPGVGSVKARYRLLAPGIDESYEETLSSYVTGDLSSEVALPLLRFEDPSAFESDGGALSVTVADLDGDGAAELIYKSAGYRYGKQGVYVIWGRSDGRVEPVNPPGAEPCGTPGYLVAADFDGDGRIEVALANLNCGVRILQWNAKREVTTHELLKTDRPAWMVWAGDVDGRGRTALLLPSGKTPSGVTVWRADAAGRLQPGETMDFGGSQGIVEIAVADLNGDGRPDLVATLADYLPSGGLSILLQRSSGGYDPPIGLPSRGTTMGRPLAVGDLDGDGRPEIVAAGADDGGAGVSIHRVKADGSVTTSRQNWGTPRGLHIADIDGDGRLDLIMAQQVEANTVEIRYQQADGTLSAPDPVYNEGRVYYPDSLAVGDLNGDGRLDITFGGARLLQRAVPVTAPMSAERTVRTMGSAALGGPPHRLLALQQALRQALRQGLARR